MEDIIYMILINTNFHDLNGMMVNTYIHHLLQSNHFWHDKFIYDQIPLPSPQPDKAMDWIECYHDVLNQRKIDQLVLMKQFILINHDCFNNIANILITLK